MARRVRDRTPGETAVRVLVHGADAVARFTGPRLAAAARWMVHAAAVAGAWGRQRPVLVVGALARLAWWASLGLLTLAGPLLLGDPPDDTAYDRALAMLVAGFTTATAAAVAAPQRHVRLAAFPLALCHAAIWLAGWVALGN